MQILFTQKGYENLKNQKEKLVKSRPDAVADLKKAREMGDLSENGYYKAAVVGKESELQRIAGKILAEHEISNGTGNGNNENQGLGIVSK